MCATCSEAQIVRRCSWNRLGGGAFDVLRQMCEDIRRPSEDPGRVEVKATKKKAPKPAAAEAAPAEGDEAAEGGEGGEEGEAADAAPTGPDPPDWLGTLTRTLWPQ